MGGLDEVSGRKDLAIHKEAGVLAQCMYLAANPATFFPRQILEMLVHTVSGQPHAPLQLWVNELQMTVSWA